MPRLTMADINEKAMEILRREITLRREVAGLGPLKGGIGSADDGSTLSRDAPPTTVMYTEKIYFSSRDLDVSIDQFARKYLEFKMREMALMCHTHEWFYELFVPGGIDMADRQTDIDFGISMRAVRAYDVISDELPCRFDVMCRIDG